MPRQIGSLRTTTFFDDAILDKNNPQPIYLVHLQYSVHAHGLSEGIGMVNGPYVNPNGSQYWMSNYCLHNPEREGNAKSDRVREMLAKDLPEKAVAVG